MAGKKKIKVRVAAGIPMMKIEKFKKFQGDLKKLPDESKRNLQRSLITKGFRIPIFTWNDNILDGHQRLIALEDLLKSGKYELEGGKLPYVEIEADSEKDAKEMILAISSQYGKITEAGLSAFMELADIEYDEVRDMIDFPALDLDVFDDIGGDTFDMPEIEFTEELLESHNYVVLYFDNEIDWINAKTLLGLKTVKALDSRPGYEKKGVGRVVNGAEAIENIIDEGNKK